MDKFYFAKLWPKINRKFYCQNITKYNLKSRIDIYKTKSIYIYYIYCDFICKIRTVIFEII